MTGSNMFRSEASPHWSTARIAALGVLMLLWFGGAYLIGEQHLLTNDRQSLFAPVAITAAVPVAAFLTAYGLWTPFRNFVLSQDLRTLTESDPISLDTELA